MARDFLARFLCQQLFAMMHNYQQNYGCHWCILAIAGQLWLRHGRPRWKLLYGSIIQFFCGRLALSLANFRSRTLSPPIAR